MLGLSFDDYLSFCFDEACEYIMSFQKEKSETKEGKTYIKTYFEPKPKWSNENIVKPTSNKELFNEMQSYLEEIGGGK